MQQDNTTIVQYPVPHVVTYYYRVIIQTAIDKLVEVRMQSATENYLHNSKNI